MVSTLSSPVEPHELDDRPRHLVVVGGLDAAGAVAVPAIGGALRIGRSPDSAIHLDQPTVSRRHATISLQPSGAVVADLDSRNGTHLRGRSIGSTAEVATDEPFRLGGAAVAVRPGSEAQPERRPTGPSHQPPRSFNRPPRSGPAAVSVPLPRPPGRPRSDGPAATLSVAMLIGPLAFGAVTAALFSPVMAVFALMGPVMVLASWVERRWRSRRDGHRSAAARRRAQAEFGRALAERVADEAVDRRARHPDPATLRSWADGASRLWERRPHHHDAFELNVGLAHLAWCPPTDAASSGPSIGPSIGPGSPSDEPVVAALVDVPVVARLGPGRAIGVVGPPVARSAVLRWLVCQVTTLHGPADLRLQVLRSSSPVVDAESPDDDQWSFASRLPHHLPDESTDAPTGAGVVELTLVPDAAAEGLIGPLTGLLRSGPDRPARTALVGADSRQQLPSWCTSIIELTGEDGRATVLEPSTSEVIGDVLATGVSLPTAWRWVAALARHRDPELSSPSAGLPDRLASTDLTGPVAPATIVDGWRRARQAPTSVTAELGVAVGPSCPGAAAEPFTVDLVADGPHVLVGGTTGSGKSELLRTLVLSLALRHGPDAISFLLVDYKGGSAFDACADLPHTVGLVTDLDAHLAGRALDALDAEIRRREVVLRRAGRSDLTSMPTSPTTAPASEPGGDRGRPAPVDLARLVVVIDEFATLASELPGFLDALVDVAQRGRSLGVHLVLATQRPHGAVNDRIRTNTNLRIALRMLDRAESADVVDDPSAASIPRDRPGRAVARLGPDELVSFQTVWNDPAQLRAVVDAIVEATSIAGLAAAPTPWLPPLPSGVDLDDLLPDAGRAAGPVSPPVGRSVGPGPARPGIGEPDLVVPIALADEPHHQRQRTWGWRPARGHLLVYGMPGSGTTTALVTVGLSLARLLPPARCHLYAITDGSAALATLGGLPHVGAVIAADETRRQARLVRLLGAELDRRRDRRSSSAHQQPEPEPGVEREVEPPMIVVLVDDLPGLLRRFDTVEGHRVADEVHRVFRDGPAVGIHLAVSGDRAGAFPPPMTARTAERIVLHLPDPYDLTALGLHPSRRPPTGATAMVPGRGRVGTGAGIEVQIGRARDPAEMVRTLTTSSDPSSELVSHPTRDGPWLVLDLPTQVRADDLPAAHVHTEPGRAGRLILPIGIGDDELRPRGLELHPGQHALVVGPSRSGRSTALGVLARSAIRSGQAAVIVLSPRAPARFGADTTSVRSVEQLLAALALVGDRPTTLVLIDDADLVDDPSGALATLATSSRPGLHVVAAARADRARTQYGHWTTLLAVSRAGLALRPDLDLDGDLWRVRFPRDAESRRCEGRGFLVLDDHVELVQVARPEGRR